MPFLFKKSMEVHEPKPGWRGAFAWAPSMSFVQYEIEKGATLHEHHHDNEEVWIVLDGQLEMTLDGETSVARTGDMVVVPRNAPHSARALTAVRAIVVDQPARHEIPGRGKQSGLFSSFQMPSAANAADPGEI